MPENRYDLWSPASRTNPLPIYARMRQEAPLVRLVDPNRDMPIWLVTRYQDAVEVLREKHLTKDFRKLEEPARSRYATPGLDVLGQQMLMTDPPDHTRLRSLVSKAFTSRRIEELRPRIRDISTRLLEAAKAQGTVDLLDAFAFPLPITVIAELLGVPLEDQDNFRAWTHAMVTPSAGGREAMMAAGFAFLQYLYQLVENRRETPRDDLVSALLAVEEQGDQLNTQELIGMVFLLLIAGHETTVNLIGNGTLALLQHPEQLERLRKDRSLMESAVEEMLRYCGPVETGTSRFAVKDTELLGQVIPAGETVTVGLLAADHDPAQFPNPERFDIGRTPNKHIAFGYGIHFCLGAPLARLEATIAFDLLLEMAPGLKLAAEPGALKWREGVLVRGLEKLPVSL
jgi:cytochrome P450 PksS